MICPNVNVDTTVAVLHSFQNSEGCVRCQRGGQHYQSCAHIPGSPLYVKFGRSFSCVFVSVESDDLTRLYQLIFYTIADF